MTLGYSQNIAIICYIIVYLAKICQGIELVEPINTVWTTQEEIPELECKVDSLIQWCYWQKLGSTQKYYPSSSDKPIIVSKTNNSCKLALHVGEGDGELHEYMGDWKCHLANTDDVSDPSKFKVENVISLRLAEPSDTSFSITYKDETNMEEQIFSTIKDSLPPSSEELLEKRRILSSNESIYSLGKSNHGPESSYLPLMAGREITLSCSPNNQNAEPEPNLSLWIVSPNEERLLEGNSDSLSFTPQISDNKKSFACLSYQKNDYVEFHAIQRSSLPIYILSIPRILKYPRNIQETLGGNSPDLVTFSVTFFSQPHPTQKSITWLVNGHPLSPTDILDLQNDLVARASNIILIDKEESPSIFQIEIHISRELFESGHNVSLSVSIRNRLGMTKWSFNDNNSEGGILTSPVVSWLSMSHITTYLIIIFLILNLILIGIWCTCCCCCGAACQCCNIACKCCKCCLCPFLRKKKNISESLKEETNFYVGMQDNEYMIEREKMNGNDLSLLSPKSFTYEEEPTNKDYVIRSESEWVKLQPLSHDDTQVSVDSHSHSEFPYIDESPPSSPYSNFKAETFVTTKSTTPPPAYSPNPQYHDNSPSSTVPAESPTLNEEEVLYIEVKDQDTQTSKKVKKLSKKPPDLNLSFAEPASQIPLPNSSLTPEKTTLPKNYTSAVTDYPPLHKKPDLKLHMAKPASQIPVADSSLTPERATSPTNYISGATDVPALFTKPDLHLHIAKPASPTPVADTSLSPERITSPKNYTLSGATAYPVPHTKSQNVYNDLRGSAVENSWIRLPKEEEN